MSTYFSKYKCSFSDIKNVKWEIYIQEMLATAPAMTELIATGTPLTLEYLTDSDEFNDPVRASKAIFNVMAITDFSLISLYSDEDLHYRVLIYCGLNLKFQGFIVTSEYSEPYDQCPFPVQITAIDGLNYLRNITFDNAGTYYNGRTLESQIIFNILEKIKIYEFTEYVNLYESTMDVAAGDSPFDQVSIDVDIFQDLSCYEVLYEILKKYNAVIKQINGEIVIYRPTELIQATVYGRKFTGPVTKASVNFAPAQNINRTGTVTELMQFPGSVLMVKSAVKKITLAQDYGNKESWIDNYQFKSGTFAGTDFANWTKGGAALPLPVGRGLPAEKEGMLLASVDTYPAHARYIYQDFGVNAVITSDIFSFDFEYLFFNISPAAVNNVVYYLEIKDVAGTRWLSEVDADTAHWHNTQSYITITENVALGNTGWKKWSRQITGLEAVGPYRISIFSLDVTYGTGGIDIWAAIKNIKFFTSSYEIAQKQVEVGMIPVKTKNWITSVRNRFVMTPIYGTQFYKELRNIIRKIYTVTNAVNGREMAVDYMLGDVVDANIDNVVEQFAGSLAVSVATPATEQVDTVTLSGTTGAVEITCNGITREATFNTSLTQTAADFVTAYAADYLSAVVVTSSGANIIFTAAAAGTTFTTIGYNVNGDMNASVVSVPQTFTEVLSNTASWSTYTGTGGGRTSGAEADPLIELIGGEIGNQYSRPKQLIQMQIYDNDATDIALNMVGNIQDGLNQLSAVNRKFICMGGDYDVKNRMYNMDLIEIIL